MGGHTPEWYKEQGSAIKLRCEDQKEAVEAAHASKVNRLEDEYKREEKALGSAAGAANSAERVAGKQQGVVDKYEGRIEEAKATYKKNKNCPAELRKLEDELEALEATPNKSDADIEAEC